MQLPSLPRGSVIPNFSSISEAEKIIQENKIKEERIHDYKVTILSVIGGGIAGFISSILVWLITH